MEDKLLEIDADPRYLPGSRCLKAAANLSGIKGQKDTISLRC